MAVLLHVEREPRLVVQPVARRGFPPRMVGNQAGRIILAAGDTAGDAAGEGPQYQFTPFGRTVAAQYPDDIPPGAVTLPQIAPESLGTPPRCEDLGPGAPFEAELVAPCGQQADDQPQRVGHGDHFVHIREITLVGPGEPRIGKRQVAVGIGDTQSVTFREADGLYDREPFPGAVFEIEARLFARRTVEQLPRRVAQIEERPAVGILQVTPAGMHDDAPAGERPGAKGRRRKKERKNRNANNFLIKTISGDSREQNGSRGRRRRPRAGVAAKPGYSPSFESSSDVSIRTCVVVSLSLSA